MTAHAETVRANVRAILAASELRGRGFRQWPPVCADIQNPITVVAGQDAFGLKCSGALFAWWSDFKTRPHGAAKEVRHCLWAPLHRARLKAEFRNLIKQAARHKVAT